MGKKRKKRKRKKKAPQGSSRHNDSTSNESAPEDTVNVVRPESESPPRNFLDRFAWLILIVAVIITPFMLYGAAKSTKVYANDVTQWLPSGFEEAAVYNWFKSEFGLDEMLVASWSGCTMENEEVLALQKHLSEVQLDGELLFARVVSGPELFERIKSYGVKSKAAQNRLRGLVIGENNETTCVMAFPNDTFAQRRREVVDVVYQVAEDKLGITRSELKMGGPVVDGAAIDVESKRSLEQFMWITVLVVFFLTWFRLRDLPLSLIVLVFSVLCAAISLSVLYWTGGKMNLTMVMLPTLTFILGVSGCVHMANYYRKAAASGTAKSPAFVALTDGGYPVAVSSATTAIGLFSLFTSRVVPIKMFGLYSALGVLCSMPVILLLMPSVLYMLKGRISKRYLDKNLDKRERKTGVSRSTSQLVNWVCRSHWWVTIPAVLGLVALAIGMGRLKASVKIQNRFAERTPIIQDYRWLESELGPMVPMEVVLRFGRDCNLTLWEQLETISEVKSAIERTTAVNATYSAATFRPPVASSTGIRGKVQRKLVLDKWEENIGSLEEANLLRRNSNENLWRISLRVAAMNEIDYGDFLEDVQANVDNHIDYLEGTGKQSISATLTGGIPLLYKAQHQILSDLAKSFLTAFVIITLILIFVLGSVRGGLVAMIPNVFPPVVVFGAMGWMGVAVEIGSVMTASVALGIAVDDTIHFLTWYRRGTMQGKSRYKSIQYAFDHCAKAMIDTTTICGLGVAPFLFSVFMPTVRFSRLLLILLLTALAGDLILLPAILAGPAGLLFRYKNKLLNRKKNEPVL